MIKRFAWALCLVVVGCASAQFDPNALISMREDRFTGERRLVAENLVWGNPMTGTVDLTLSASPSGADAVALHFMKRSDIGVWWWLKHRDADAVVDGQPLRLGTGTHDSSIKGQTSIELLTVTVPADTFRRLADASSLDVRLGSRELAFEPKKLQVLRAFARQAGIK